MDREGSGASEVLQDVQGAVGGPVIAHHQLIREPGLPQEAVQLLLQKPLPVIGGHGNGNGYFIDHYYSLFIIAYY
jgi:hypothetical protein